MNITLVCNDQLKYHKISVLLRTSGFNYQHVNIRDIRKYKSDMCIIVDQGDIPNIKNIIEGIVYEELFPVIYIPAKQTLIHNAESSPIFYSLNERLLDVLLIPMCEILNKTAKQNSQIKKDLQKSRQLLEDERLINKAKLFLVEHKNFTEEDAHRYIQEEAMNRRLSRAQVAREIIK